MLRISSFQLIHVENFKLPADPCGEFQAPRLAPQGDNWLLVDTICLHEILELLGMSDNTLEDEDIAKVRITQVGDNGQFVFLRMSQCILYLDIKCRTPCKVYENKGNGQYCHSIHPLMMIWPPNFPALKDDPARFAFLSLEDLYSSLVKVAKCYTMHLRSHCLL